MRKDDMYTRYKQGEAVVDQNYSYTEFFEGDKYLGNMLYDLDLDGKQNIDISKESENKMVVEKYSQKLKAMRDMVNENPFD